MNNVRPGSPILVFGAAMATKDYVRAGGCTNFFVFSYNISRFNIVAAVRILGPTLSFTRWVYI